MSNAQPGALAEDEAAGAAAAGPRVALVTGATDGIGRAVALGLARGGHRVLAVGRDHDRGAAIDQALRAIAPHLDHRFVRADLSLLAETARLADAVADLTAHLDATVLCAGVLSTIPEWTAEQLERNLVLNYLSRYLLARRLLPLMRRAPSGRLVLVANAGRYRDTLDLDDMQYRNGKPGLRVSGRTQYANDLLAVEAAARLQGTSVQVTCVYPGLARTAVFRNARGLPWLARRLAPAIQRLAGRSPEAAADTPVFLAQSPDAAGNGGRFYGPARREIPVPSWVQRPERRAALWHASEALVRAYLPHA